MRILENRGKWFKANLHMHTTVSDGALEPRDAVGIYRSAGYDLVAITDHREESPLWEGDGFLVLPGVEWDTGDVEHQPVYHILGIGMKRETVDFYSGAPYEGAALGRGRAGIWVTTRGRSGMRRSEYHPHPQAVIDAIRAAGGIAILAHPAWSVMAAEEMMNLRGLVGAEIFNSISNQPWNPGRSESSSYWDQWGKKGIYVRAFANDDSHLYEGEHLKGFTMINAPELTVEAVMDALRRGNFYASCGPRFYGLELEEDSRLLKVECSEDVEAVAFYTNTPWGDRNYQRIRGGGTAAFRTSATDRFVRVELIDKEGRKAWSHAYPVGIYA